MASASALPEQFGRYRILRRIGAGGMGAVYLAEDALLARRVALKVPHFNRGGDEARVVERFYREARVAAGLDHPHVCPVYDVGQIDGVHYLTMPFIEGTPLSQLVDEERPWPAREAAVLVRKLALALAALHEREVIHRDLKPGNVLVRPEGEPVLMDFGLARLLSRQGQRLTTVGQAVGTPAYMPPEQVVGDPEALGPASDVYSLGVILYELVTGRRPFRGRLEEVYGQILYAAPEPPSARRPGLGPEVDALCLKALAKKPAERFRSMAEFAEALQEQLLAPAAVPLPAIPPPATGAHQPTLATRAPRATGPTSVAPWDNSVRASPDPRRGATGKQPAGPTRPLALPRGVVEGRKGEPGEAESGGRPSGGWRPAWLWVALLSAGALTAVALGLAGLSVAVRKAKRLGAAPSAAEVKQADAGTQRAEQLRRLVQESRAAAQVKDFDGARRKLAEADQLDAGDAQVQQVRQELEKAREQERRAARARELAEESRACLGWNDFDGAGRKLAEADGLDPGNTEVRQARRELEKARERWATWVRELLEEGRACVRGNDFDKAARRLAEADQLDPGNAAVQQAQLDLDAARSWHRLERWGQVVPKYEAALQEEQGALTGKRYQEAMKKCDAATQIIREFERELGAGPETTACVTRAEDRKALAQERHQPASMRYVVAAKLEERSRLDWAAFSPDGSRLVSVGPDKVSSEKNNNPSTPGLTVRVWDVASGKLLHTLGEHARAVCHEHGVRLAVAGDDNLVKVLDVASGKELPTRGYAEGVASVAFTSDGLACVESSGVVRICDLGYGQGMRTRFRRIEGQVVAFGYHFSSKLASISDKTVVKVWNVIGDKERLTLRGHTGPVEKVIFDPTWRPRDISRLVSAGRDGTVRVWSLYDGKELHTLVGRDPAFSPDGRHLAYASDNKTVKLFDLVGGKELHSFGGRGSAFSPDGTRLATVRADGAVAVWDADGGQELHTLRSKPHRSEFLFFSPDGTRLAVAATDGTVEIWKLAPAKGRASSPAPDQERNFRQPPGS